MKYYYTPTKVTKTKFENNKCWQGWVQRKHLHTISGMETLTISYKTKCNNPVILFLDNDYREMKTCWKKDLYKNIHSNFIITRNLKWPQCLSVRMWKSTDNRNYSAVERKRPESPVTTRKNLKELCQTIRARHKTTHTLIPFTWVQEQRKLVEQNCDGGKIHNSGCFNVG